MTPAQLAERRAALATVVTQTKAGLSGVLLGFQPGSDEHRAIRDANVRIDELLHRLTVVSDGLALYTDPDFYRELLPSKALDDQGLHARNKLEQAFPE